MTNNKQTLLLWGWLFFASANVCADELPEFDCLIEPWQKVEISFAARGILDQIHVEESDTVNAGQVLAQLESGLESTTVKLRRAKADIEDEVKSSEASLAFSERNLKRIQDLYQKKAVPFHKLDEAQTEKYLAERNLLLAKSNQRMAQLELEMAQQSLARRTVTSPIDAIVVERYKSVGEYVEDEPVMTLVQLDPLRVEVLLPVSLFGRIEVGQNAKVIPEAPMDKQVHFARVVIVDRSVDVASGTFGVQLELKNADLELPSGLKCGVRFM
jgi:RND family efflux transporter MFP subunit